LGGKHGPYDEAIRIPLLIRYPKLIKPGTAIASFALNIDLAPTMLDAAGAPRHAEMQGRSLMPLLQGKTESARSSFLAEFFLGSGTPRFPTWQAVRTARWKYIRYEGMPELDELYDLQADSSEMNNLVQDASAKKPLQEMRAELERLIKEEN